ncbi:MAG: hypothetical protein O2890_10270 [Cyanobacteria bacterium]|nr:hypothetical protein [Cyanobacteriota bacterium]MDA0866785.1 hypothetical protein [Cyanobacteriota bacterium]
MRSTLRAGVLYFAIIFAVGFALGTTRVLLLVPRLGAVTSELIELPIILTAAWSLCGRLVARYQVPHHWQARLSMGAIAFTLLMIAEAVLSVALFGNSITAHFASYRSLYGGLGLLGQVIFATFPLVQLPAAMTQTHSGRG